MITIRTDLAEEARGLWKESAGETSELKGVKAREETIDGLKVTRVEVLNQEGADALGKPVGSYITVEVGLLWRHEEEGFSRAARTIADQLEPMLPEEGAVLVVGIGNAAMTADALGPQTLDHLLITRHLGKILPSLRPVAALGAGVLGSTGMEVAEWVLGAAEHVKPAAVVVVDALAARDLGRLCNTVQLSDTGLIPGSGVGNHRKALDKANLGVPVLSVGVPTVVDAETVARDILREAGGTWETPPSVLRGQGKKLFVTPDCIDSRVRALAKLLGYSINLALQPSLELEDLEQLLA